MIPAIETIDLTKRYGTTLALNKLNLRVRAGSIYGFIGPNGAGKTTTLRLLAGMVEPSSGDIRLMGQAIPSTSIAWQVGYMPDFFGVYDDLRVWEYLDFFARCYRLSSTHRHSTIEQLLDLVDLTPQRNAFVQTLSRGQQQRLCLAHALVHNPAILLLDEPASGLDPRARVEFRELLRTLRDMGKTVLLSSHILSELAEICDEIGIINQGQLLASGPIEDIRHQLHVDCTLHIQTLSPVERVLSILRSYPGISRATVHKLASGDSAKGRPATLAVHFDGDEQARAALLADLLAQGVFISDFHAREESLETIFLRLT